MDTMNTDKKILRENLKLPNFGNFFMTELAYSNWSSKYQYGDETPLQTFVRAARALASVEKENQEYWFEKFLTTLVKFSPIQHLYPERINDYTYEDQEIVKKFGFPIGLKTTLGGRITANIGTEFGGTTLLNCFISYPLQNVKIQYKRKIPGTKDSINIDYTTEDNPDNLSNIYLTLLEQAETLKSEGGWGINFSWIRPRSSLIEGVGIKHPGVVKYLELFDKSAEVIVQGDSDGYKDKLKNYLETDNKSLINKISKKIKKMARKGAQMCVLNVSHPDIEEFVRAKQTPGKLTKFNISVLITDEFMNAVENDELFDLTFKDKVYKTVKARELYDLIMESTYNRAEPGILFYNSMQANNPISYLGNLTATNPCFTADNYLFTKDGVATFGQLYSHNELLEVLQDKRIESQNEETFVVRSNFSGIRTTKTQSPVVKTQIDAKVVRINFTDGSSLKLTPNHRLFTQQNVIQANQVKPGMKLLAKALELHTPTEKHELADLAFLLGLIDGDGSVTENSNSYNVHIDLWGKDLEFLLKTVTEKIEKLYDVYGSEIIKDRNSEIVPYYITKISETKSRISSSFIYHLLKKKLGWEKKKIIPEIILNTSRKFNLFTNYFAGLFFTDGTINKHSKASSSSLRIAQSNKEYLNVIQTALSSIGIHSSVYLRKKERQKLMPDGKGGNKLYSLLEQYELIISQGYFSQLNILFSDFNHYKINKLQQLTTTKPSHSSYVIVKSIEELPNEDVYCLKEDNHRTIIVNNVSATRCGEIGGNPETSTVCLLGNINLTQYVYTKYKRTKDENGKEYSVIVGRDFDWVEYEKDISIFARMLDNVNDLTYAPLAQYTWAVKNIRQYGMGITGLGSTLFMLGIPFNSQKALELTEQFVLRREDISWKTSALLAKEKGPFPMYDKEKFESTNWFTNFTKISEETKNLIKLYGVRNSKTSTNAPNGNCVSIDTKIRTSMGLMSMGDIFTEHGIDTNKQGWYFPKTLLNVETTDGLQHITGFYVNGVVETNCVSTDFGTLNITDYHRLLVKVDDCSAVWKYAHELKIGDKILQQI